MVDVLELSVLDESMFHTVPPVAPISVQVPVPMLQVH